MSIHKFPSFVSSLPGHLRFDQVASRFAVRLGVTMGLADLRKLEQRIGIVNARRLKKEPSPIMFPKFCSENQIGRQFWSVTISGVYCIIVVHAETLKIISARGNSKWLKAVRRNRKKRLAYAMH